MTPTMEIVEHVSPKENERICRLVHAALKRGDLIKPSECSWCGDTTRPIHGHHPDYARPLMVVWICVRCHRDHHRLYADERRMRGCI